MTNIKVMKHITISDKKYKEYQVLRHSLKFWRCCHLPEYSKNINCQKYNSFLLSDFVWKNLLFLAFKEVF